ncbi:MAG: DUF1761 domain-containing protein [Halocynthiibacter sp.]
MEMLSVLVAAIASYGFGAVWYMKLGSAWKADVGLTDEDIKAGGASAYVIAFVASLMVAGMMRHMFALAAIDGAGKGLVAGLGLGLFVAAPWIVMNYSFAMRPKRLIMIDGLYATIGCAIMGVVLTLF